MRPSAWAGQRDHELPKLLLKPQIVDTEVPERVVRDSDLDWVIAQPVHLTDDDDDKPPFVSADGDTRLLSVSRKRVARFLVDSLRQPELRSAAVALSR